MPTSPTSSFPAATDSSSLRLVLNHDAAAHLDGAWWPRSRHFREEGVSLVDGFPSTSGTVYRLLFSRPDWDDATVDGSSIRRIRARRGFVKVGSFPRDDTQLMILTMDTGRRIRLTVVPSDIDETEGRRRMRDAAVSVSR